MRICTSLLFLWFFFILCLDNIMIRFALRHCQHHFRNLILTHFVCPNEPTYILSHNCTDEYYGWAGPCCKVDEGISSIISDHPKLFKNVKFLIHGDDDTYWRGDLVMKWLAKINNAGLDDFPIIANKVSDMTYRNRGIWHIEGCHDIQSSGWYQPMVLNRAALLKIQVPFASYGLSDTCKNFVVTHDVGMEVLAWLLQLYHISIPQVELNVGHHGSDIFKPDQMVVHALGHSTRDKCRSGDEKQWPSDIKYDQKVLIGCGDIDHPSPFHDSKQMADMYDAFRYFKEYGKSLDFGVPGINYFIKTSVIYKKDPTTKKKIIWKIIDHTDKNYTLSVNGRARDPLSSNMGLVEDAILPMLTFLDGYQNTEHSKVHNVTELWHPFTLLNCSEPGSIIDNKPPIIKRRK